MEENVMRKYALLGLGAIVLLWLLIFVATHSFVVVHIDDQPGTSDAHISLTDSSGTVNKTETRQQSVRKFVSRGSYQLIVQTDKGSSFNIVSAGGFLRTTNVTTSLVPESFRKFVGANPGPCMFYPANQLFSGECDEATALQEHMPATADSPSYVQDVPGNQLYGQATNIVTTRSGSLIRLYNTGDDEATYVLNQLRPDLSIAATKEIQVPADDEFRITPYKDGVLVYNTNLTQFEYYASIDAKPEKISLESAQDKKLNPLQIGASSDGLALIYTETEHREASGDENMDENEKPTPQKGKTEVVVFRNDKEQEHFSFGNIYKNGRVCGESKLCLLDNTGMTVFDISGSKAKKAYAVSGVTELHESFNGLLAFTAAGVLDLDINTDSGHYSYTFGGFTNCGLFAPAPHGYLVCVADPKGNRSALYIDQTAANSDSIDKQVLTLAKVDGVSSASAYGNIVYVVPDYGELVYDPNTNLNIFDPARSAKINQAISSAIASSGIDRKVYQVYNLGSGE